MPFFHDQQMEVLRTPLMMMTGSHGDMSVIQAFGAVDLRYSGGVWQIRSLQRDGGAGPEWDTLADQNFYIPPFRVVAVSVGLADPSGQVASFYHLKYDLPTPGNQLYNHSDTGTWPYDHGNGDWFPTAVKSPCWITRLRLSDAATTATKITLWR